jgi:oxygen-independent coproporphyrinogen-3 oxidase
VFDRVSFDLIYARQGQSVTDWTAELRRALDLAVDHLSLYQLTIEDGTAFGDRYAAGKLRGLPDDDAAADMYAVTQEICEKAGFAGYEVSNHARAGCESIHNKIYWRYGDYAGIGPGAHGRLTLHGQRFATEAPRAPAGWLAQVRKTGNGDLSREALTQDEQFGEFLLMGRRLREGVEIARFPQFKSDTYINKINGLIDLGMVTCDARTLQLTPQGAPVLNAVLRALLDD